MTDAEVICEFMEARPWMRFPPEQPRWWVKQAIMGEDEYSWHARDALTLDALHEVEAKLDSEQWELYREALSIPYMRSCPSPQDLIHLSADEKIAALAAVLRKENT